MDAVSPGMSGARHQPYLLSSDVVHAGEPRPPVRADTVLSGDL